MFYILLQELGLSSSCYCDYSSCVGPSYVPIKVRLPYRTSAFDVPPPISSEVTYSQKVASSQFKPTNIIQKDNTGRADPGMYPSLPNVGTYDPQLSQQGYPQTTYLGQHQAQEQGQVYQPSESTHLLPN